MKIAAVGVSSMSTSTGVPGMAVSAGTVSGVVTSIDRVALLLELRESLTSKRSVLADVPGVDAVCA